MPNTVNMKRAKMLTKYVQGNFSLKTFSYPQPRLSYIKSLSFDKHVLSMGQFSHLKQGQADMVDVQPKVTSARTARCKVEVDTLSFDLLKNLDKASQKELICTMRIAAIQAAKKTSEIIPLCHPIPLEKLSCDVSIEKHKIYITFESKCSAKTGVEMEAMTGAAAAALTAYDMIKAQVPEAVIDNLRLERKEGGKSGLWSRDS